MLSVKCYGQQNGAAKPVFCLARATSAALIAQLAFTSSLKLHAVTGLPLCDLMSAMSAAFTVPLPLTSPIRKLIGISKVWELASPGMCTVRV